MRPFLETNVYSFRGRVLLLGACLPELEPEAVERLCREADQIYTLCLEQTHLNMAVTKLTAILGTGQVSAFRFASVDRSPHCVQMHYMRHEIERVLPEHVPMESFVVVRKEIIPVSEAAIEASKTLSMLSGR